MIQYNWLKLRNFINTQWNTFWRYWNLRAHNIVCIVWCACVCVCVCVHQMLLSIVICNWISFTSAMKCELLSFCVCVCAIVFISWLPTNQNSILNPLKFFFSSVFYRNLWIEENDILKIGKNLKETHKENIGFFRKANSNTFKRDKIQRWK